jgi:inositol oxygenase
VIDPSELLRPEPDFTEKAASKFRDYSVDETDPLKERVRKTYRDMHLNQTVDFVKRECHSGAKALWEFV